MHTNAGAALLSIALVACSSSPSGTGGGGTTTSSTTTSSGAGVATVTGTLAGRALSPAHATAAKGIDDPSYPNQITVLIANQPDPCALLQASADHPGLSKANLLALALVLGETQANGPAVTPGTYTPGGTPDELTATLDALDASCQTTQSEQTAGSVTITAAGASFTGTFDLTFGADHVTGSFDAPLCNLILDGGTTGDGGTVCQP